jgi:hypothetical protein
MPVLPYNFCRRAETSGREVLLSDLRATITRSEKPSELRAKKKPRLGLAWHCGKTIPRSQIALPLTHPLAYEWVADSNGHWPFR